MDEHYAFFLEKIGLAIERHEVPVSSIAKYKNKLPDQLLDYWEEYGWSGYANGAFWTVNPQNYEYLLKSWLTAVDMPKENYCVIARSAFGKLYVWGEKSGWCLTISSYSPRYFRRTSKFTGENLTLA